MAQVTELGAGEATKMQQEARGDGDEAGRAGRRRRGSAPASCMWAVSVAVT